MVDETSLGFDPLRFDLELNRRGSAAATECQGAGVLDGVICGVSELHSFNM